MVRSSEPIMSGRGGVAEEAGCPTRGQVDNVGRARRDVSVREEVPGFEVEFLTVTASMSITNTVTDQGYTKIGAPHGAPEPVNRPTGLAEVPHPARSRSST